MGTRRGPVQPLLSDLFSDPEWNRLAEHFGLSKRQSEIARLICRGCTNEAIAVRLRLSEATVRMHTDGLYKRVGIQSRIGLLVWFVDAVRRSGENGRQGGAP